MLLFRVGLERSIGEECSNFGVQFALSIGQAEGAVIAAFRWNVATIPRAFVLFCPLLVNFPLI
jgi:hypothetical protein